MLTTILNWLSGGVAASLIDAYKAKLAAGNTEDKLAADLAAKEIDARQAIVRAELGSWFTALPRVVMEMSVAIYMAKLLVWDKVLALGSTDPLNGDVGTWANIVLTGLFGSSIAGRVVSALTSRK